MRVYELAKKLGMENRDLIPELKRMGVPVTSHSSTLDEGSVEKALERLGGKAGSTAAAGKAAARGDDREGKKEPAGRKTAGKATAVPAVEESAKPDKRRILFKRRKAEDQTAVPAAESSAADTAAPVGAPSFERPDAGLTADAGLPDQSVLPSSRERPAKIEPFPAGGPAPAPPGAPAEPAATASPTAAAERERGDLHHDKKKGVAVQPMAEDVESLKDKDKGKRVRRPGRTRQEEDADLRGDAARWKDLRTIALHRRDDRSRHHQATTSPTDITKPRKKVIKLTTGLTVKEYAERVGQRPGDVIRRLMEMGQMLTVNQPMVMDAGVLIAESLGLKAEVASEKEGDALLEEAVEWQGEEQVEPRPPVVTIMGHVDHGKTSLLDAIRQTKVTEQEAGGITQHIGAYMVRERGKPITFLDTPGHEAFTAMRSRGAKITDIVILVVAADDGVMPQTVEAIHHATAAGVAIIVAINKIDKPGSNPDRVRHALAEHNLIPESWGGQTIFVEVSAKQKLGLDHLLEMILLQAEVLELKANPNRPAVGTVLEAKLDRGRGAVATVLVQNGTLTSGDAFVVGVFSGKVRALASDTGAKLSEAGPSVPVEVIGLPGVPAAGDAFIVVKDERVAREIAQSRMQKQRTAELAAAAPRVTLDDLYSRIQEGDVKELSVIIKADVQGSAEALAGAVEKLSSNTVRLRVIHNGVGAITETDVQLASASGAIIIGFNIRPESKAAALAEREGVDVRLYTVIYNAIADIKAAMEGLLEPTFKERVLGRAEVRQVFSVPKIGSVAGCYVTDGTISRSSSGVRVLRDHVTVYEGKLGSLRRFKDDVREVQQGYECGLGVENFSDIKVGDIIEAYALDRVAGKL